MLARGGIVCASVPQAAAAGVAALERGGNAVDAALAAAAMLAVGEPMQNGVGGAAREVGSVDGGRSLTKTRGHLKHNLVLVGLRKNGGNEPLA